jgi:hypothetical protein
MQMLLGVGKVQLNELAKQDIAVRGEKRGTYRLCGAPARDGRGPWR